MTATERVGLFGGAFDPPHRAHRALVEAALKTLPLDRLHVLPTGQAWHKSRPLSAAVHRLAMCELAFADLPGVVIDRREIDRPGATYTADTVDAMAAEWPLAAWFLLIGEDQYLRFTTWRRWPDLLNKATLVVAARPESGPSALVQSSLPVSAVPFLRLNMPQSPISSTVIRDMASRHDPGLNALVPEAVARYISIHSLYPQPS